MNESLNSLKIVNHGSKVIFILFRMEKKKIDETKLKTLLSDQTFDTSLFKQSELHQKLK
jgi:hypothetical protein